MGERRIGDDRWEIEGLVTTDGRKTAWLQQMGERRLGLKRIKNDLCRA